MERCTLTWTMTTLPDPESAARVSRAVLDARVAACVNRLSPCESDYHWEGRIENAREWPLLIKTTRDRYAALESVIRSAHPYDTPEIVAFPLAGGLASYLEWVGREVGQ